MGRVGFSCSSVLQNLSGEPQDLVLLLLAGLYRLPLLIGDSLTSFVRAVLADQQERRQKDRFQRDGSRNSGHAPADCA